MKLIFPLIILLSISKIGKSQDSNILVFYSILKEKKFQNLIGEKYIIPKKMATYRLPFLLNQQNQPRNTRA